MNSIFYLSIVIFIICIAFISYTLFLECKKQGFVIVKRVIRNTEVLKKDYAIFGMGLGSSISGFSLVEVLKGSAVDGWSLLIIFFAGVYIFEMSRRISKKAS